MSDKKALMYRNFDKPILDAITGEPIPYFVADGKGGQTILVKNGMPVPMTPRIVVIQLLMANLMGDETTDIEERLDRGRLAEKLRDGGTVGLTLDEVTLAKKICDKACTAGVALPTRIALETDVPMPTAPVPTMEIPNGSK